MMKFYACDDYEQGLGRTIWLMIDNYSGDSMNKFKEFVEFCDYYDCIEELTEDVFLQRYNEYLPEKVKTIIQKKNCNFFHKQQIHFNYS
jgi:hypothetical protein